MVKKYCAITVMILVLLAMLMGCGGAATTTPAAEQTTAPQPTVTVTQMVTATPEPTTAEPTTTSEPEPTPAVTQEPEPTPEPEPTTTPEPTPEEPVFTLISSAFGDNEMIPVKYTYDGEDISPPLSWSETPEGTVSYALIMEDPDPARGAFVHWIVFNIPADVFELAEGITNSPQLENGAKQGTNNYRTIGYAGPRLPAGILHHFVFTLYALDITLNLTSYDTESSLLANMGGHILAQAKYTGIYEVEESS